MPINSANPRVRIVYSSIAAFFLYVLLTAIATYPLLFNAYDHIYVGLSDPLANVWNLSWAQHALTTDPLHLYHANRLYPLEYSFATTYQSIPLQIIYIPLQVLSGNQVWATNITKYFTYVLCGFSFFLLIFHWTRHILVSFCAGCMFAFSPVRLPSEQLSLLAHFWTPLALLFLDRYFHSHRFGDIFWCAVFSAGQILTAIETGFFLFFSFALYILLIRWWDLWRKKKHILHLAVALTLFAFSVFPFMHPYRMLQKKYGFQRSLGETMQYSGDPICSYLQAKSENHIYGKIQLANEYNPLPGEEELFQIVITVASAIVGEDAIIKKLGIEQIPGNTLSEKISLKKLFDNWSRKDLAKPMFQGFLTIIFGILGIRFLRRSELPHFRRLGDIFLGIVIFGFVMSLGPVLIICGHLTYIPLPYLLLYYVFPGFSVLRGVYRFMFMVSLALSLAGAFGIFSFITRHQFLKIKSPTMVISNYLFAGIICMGLLLESLSIPMHMVRVPVGNEIPLVYQWLAKEKIEGALFEIPTIKGSLSKYDPNPRFAGNRKMYNDREILYSYYSTYHFHKMVNGVGSFLPPERQEIFNNLYRLPDSSSVEYFKNLNVRTFVLHTDQFEPEDDTIWTPENFKAMGASIVFQDGSDIVVYLE